MLTPTLRLLFPLGFLCCGAAALAVGPSAGDPADRAPRVAAPIDGRSLGLGRRVRDFGGRTLEGAKFELGDVFEPGGGAARPRAVVIAMTSASCPITRKYGPALARLESEFRSKGVTFVFVASGEADSVAELRRHCGPEGHAFKGPVLADRDGLIALALGAGGAEGATTTAEVFVLDSARTLVYRGAIDDQYALGTALPEPRNRYLSDALASVMKGERPTVGATSAPGCVLGFKPAQAGGGSTGRAAPAANTFHNRISRIVQDNCVSCHRPGGVGPFTLETYASVSSRARMIASVVDDGTMPPWHAAPPADGGVSPWRNDRALSSEDRKDLLAWLASDRPEGDPKDAPLPRIFAGAWTMGEPDLVVQLPEPISVKAEGVMPYRHVRVETKLAEDKWVRGIEVLPTDRSVVHHVLIFAVPPGPDGELPKRPLSALIDETRTYFAAYVPGGSPAVYPAGYAKLLPKGSLLIFQLHYTPNGKATTDQTRLGLMFAEGPPAHPVEVTGIANRKIRIPAGDANHIEQAELRVPRDARILSFMPHMHTRGKAMRYELVRRGSAPVMLLDVPRYDFNWQMRYELSEPLPVKSGETLRLTAAYDNSAGNPANPNPGVEVRWGPQTTDEMMLGYVEYYLDSQPGEEGGPTPPEPDRPDREGKPDDGPGGRAERLLKMFDKNHDGKIQRSECPARLVKQFEAMDKNQDGVLEGAELQ